MAAPGKSNQKQRMNRRNRSGYRGVSFHTQSQRWRVAIVGHGRKVYIGTFLDPVEGARAYDWAARKYHGPDAAVNFVEPQEYTPAVRQPKFGCFRVTWVKRDRIW